MTYAEYCDLVDNVLKARGLKHRTVDLDPSDISKAFASGLSPVAFVAYARPVYKPPIIKPPRFDPLRDDPILLKRMGTAFSILFFGAMLFYYWMLKSISTNGHYVNDQLMQDRLVGIVISLFGLGFSLWWHHKACEESPCKASVWGRVFAVCGGVLAGILLIGGLTNSIENQVHARKQNEDFIRPRNLNDDTQNAGFNPR